MKLTAIYIYPVKSLAGISLQKAVAQRRGLQFDRRWMLTDANGLFLSQRKHPQMALLQPQILNDELMITDKRGERPPLHIPLQLCDTGVRTPVQVWDDTLEAMPVASSADRWFSEVLQMDCRLVQLPAGAIRQVDQAYAQPGDMVSFADGFPYLLANTASLADLNQRLDKTIPMNRFRPNLVFEGTEAWQEDQWTQFSIGQLQFRSTKPCARCQVVTIDQETTERQPEVLKVMADFRKKNNKVLFGLNACFDPLQSEGNLLQLGDEITGIYP